MDSNLNRIRDDALNKGIEIGEEQFKQIGFISKQAVKALKAGLKISPLVLLNKTQVHSEAIYIKVSHETEVTGIQGKPPNQS